MPLSREHEQPAHDRLTEVVRRPRHTAAERGGHARIEPMREADPTRRIALRNRLTVRFGLALCLGAAVILLAAGTWNVGLQRDHLTRLVRSSAARSADIIRQSTRDAMLDNDPEEVHRILARIGGQRDVDRIRIFDKQGCIITSTDPEEAGQYVDTQAEQCLGCHREATPQPTLETGERVRIFAAQDGHRVLGVTIPIPNEADCSSAACHVHPEDQSVLGVLDVQMPLGPVEEPLRASQRQLLIGWIVTTAALLVLAGLLTWGMVLRPVRRLTAATRRVARGDLSTEEPVVTRDEIGLFTASWNAMVGELRGAREERERWTDTLEERVAERSRELTEAHRQMVGVERMASLGKLAAVVAHEVNNPLAGIATYARLLRRRLGRRENSTHDDERVLELMETEAARCGDIVRNLLLFSRTPGTRYTDADLGEILGRCLLLIHHQADLQEVVLRSEVHPDLPPIRGEPSQLQQLGLALTMNALEAMPEGGVLTVRAVPAGADHVEIVVADDGRGIDPTDLPHVFEPFFTTKEAGKGVGLGLAVVYGIVRRHGGTVRVDSRPGEGARFTIRLPRVPPADMPADAPEVAMPLEEVT